MTLKKTGFDEEEIPIFDQAVVYKRGQYWQFRMWLVKEAKYARKSLRTTNKNTAIEKGKEAYLEIFASQKMGKTYFSLTVKEGVKKYLENRQKDVEIGLIVAGRFSTIKTHLDNWLDFIGRETKLKELSPNDCLDYFHHRMKKSKGNIKQITVRNEQSTINACIKYLFRNHFTHIDKFDFKKLPRIDRINEAIRRSTFEPLEYYSVVQVLPGYCNRRKHQLDHKEWLTRQIMRHWILIAAISGLRVGEQRQLRWSNIELMNTITEDHNEYQLAIIKVSAAISKVRTSREFICKGGHYFRRLRKLTQPKHETDLIFSHDGKTELSKRAMLYHFNKILDLADIQDRENRDLVPYSLRHYMITNRIMSGVSHRQIADMCGTSVIQIEKTYYHLNDEIRLENALA